MNTDLISILDLEEYAGKFNYAKTNLLYFQIDRFIFIKRIRLCYDDESVRKMINVCIPYKEIKLFIDNQKWFQCNEPHLNRVNFDSVDNVGGDVINEMVESDKGINVMFGSDCEKAGEIDKEISEMFGNEKEISENGGESEKDKTEREDLDYMLESEHDSESEIDKSQFYQSQLIEEEGYIESEE